MSRYIMGKERMLLELQTRQERINRLEEATFRLGNLSNALQRSDFSKYPRLSPYKRTGDGMAQQLNRNLNIIRRIKQVSIPKLNSEISGSEKFIEENWTNLPLRVQLGHQRRIRKVPISQVARHVGINPASFWKFELGQKPPNEKMVSAYCDAFKLNGAERKNYMDVIEEERAELRRRFVKKRVENKEPIQPEKAPFGVVLRRLRETAGLSLKALAKETGLTPGGIWRVENGTTEDPYESTLVKLLKARSITVPEEALPEWLTNPSNKGQYLRSLRVRAGITSAEFSETTGRHQSSIMLTERGNRAPTKKTIKLYEQVLGKKIVFPDFSTAMAPELK